jgi:hypothetical protein
MSSRNSRSKLNKSHKNGRSRQNRNKERNDEERKLVPALLDEIIEILKKRISSSKTYTCVGLDLFLNFFEICLKRTDPDFERQIEKAKVEIRTLLVDNIGWLNDFLVRFPFIFLTEIYSPITICKLRSGVEFFLDRWGDSICGDKTIEETLRKLLSFLDSGLERWLKIPANWEFENSEPEKTNIPLEHRWWLWSPKDWDIVGCSVDKPSISEIPNINQLKNKSNFTHYNISTRQ